LGKLLTRVSRKVSPITLSQVLKCLRVGAVGAACMWVWTTPFTVH